MTDLLTKMPLEEGETITAIACAQMVGWNGVVCATSLNRVFVVRIERGGDVMVAGPLEWFQGEKDG